MTATDRILTWANHPSKFESKSRTTCDVKVEIKTNVDANMVNDARQPKDLFSGGSLLSKYVKQLFSKDENKKETSDDEDETSTNGGDEDDAWNSKHIDHRHVMTYNDEDAPDRRTKTSKSVGAVLMRIGEADDSNHRVQDMEIKKESWSRIF